MKHEVITLTKQIKLVHNHIGGVENNCEACEAGYILLAKDAEYEDQTDRNKIKGESRISDMTTSKEYASMQLKTLTRINNEAGIYLSDELIGYAHKLINESIENDFVFPAITSAENNELIFYWRAGITSIEVDIDCEEGYYVRVRRANGTEQEEMGMVKDIPYTFIKQELKLFTERVNELNPIWKELFQIPIEH